MTPPETVRDSPQVAMSEPCWPIHLQINTQTFSLGRNSLRYKDSVGVLLPYINIQEYTETVTAYQQMHQ